MTLTKKHKADIIYSLREKRGVRFGFLLFLMPYGQMNRQEKHRYTLDKRVIEESIMPYGQMNEQEKRRHATDKHVVEESIMPYGQINGQEKSRYAPDTQATGVKLMPCGQMSEKIVETQSMKNL